MLPGGAAERAVIEAVAVLVARELADFAEGRVVEIIAVTVEAIFGEIFVVFYPILATEIFGFSPGFGFNFEEFDI